MQIKELVREYVKSNEPVNSIWLLSDIPNVGRWLDAFFVLLKPYDDVSAFRLTYRSYAPGRPRELTMHVDFYVQRLDAGGERVGKSFSCVLEGYPAAGNATAIQIVRWHIRSWLQSYVPDQTQRFAQLVRDETAPLDIRLEALGLLSGEDICLVGAIHHIKHPQVRAAVRALDIAAGNYRWHWAQWVHDRHPAVRAAVWEALLAHYEVLPPELARLKQFARHDKSALVRALFED